MSGTYPDTPAPIAVSISSASPSMVSTSHALNVQARSRGAQRWAFVVTYPRGRTAAEIRALWAFLIAQKGRAGSFGFRFPTMFNRGVNNNAGVVNGSSQAGQAVITDGWAAGDIVAGGDFVTFGTQPKVYMATSDCVADGAGAMTLQIVPMLVTAPVNNAAVNLHRAVAPLTWTCGLTSDSVTIDINHCEKYGLEVELQERV
jgi:hypothetical protein